MYVKHVFDKCIGYINVIYVCTYILNYVRENSRMQVDGIFISSKINQTQKLHSGGNPVQA